jgi:uncharacterized protein YPO0396
MLLMYDLFTSDTTRAGFRLEYMEVLNWGTFDKDIYRISPGGNNSLLTGANGSGKTTYVDALLTLLVPIKKYRFYNRSSGTDKKNERTEESYVRGAYSEIQEEGKTYSKIEYLRPDKNNLYSILLACFDNDGRHKVTIFQARWFFNGELKRTYGICRGKLTIADDFQSFDHRGEWKRALKRRFPKQGIKEPIEFFDTGKKYADKLLKHFGMRSEKALSLFNQTVGIKVLGNLDQFIRTNMLEPQEVEEEFVKLKENYNTLLVAHRQIEKATEQAKLLTPIRDLARKVKDYENRLKVLKWLSETGKIYFNHRLWQFLAHEIEIENRNLVSFEQKIEVVDERLEACNNKRTDLQIAIDKDETGRRLKDIARELKAKEKEKTKRKVKQQKYNELAEKIKLPKAPDDELFRESREKAITLKKNTRHEIEQFEEKRFHVKKSKLDSDNTFKELETEVRQLMGQKNKITGRVSEIRSEIVRYVKAAPDEIPFIGELIMVKDSQKDWEPALERLLHNFALRLLVPDKYYDNVNRYVNENNLRGRIVYHRVKDEVYTNINLLRPKGVVLEKLNLKKTVYHDWIEYQLLNYYNYICVEQVADFHKYKRALTMQGLIKNNDHHQKDDRPEIIRRERFVLGWDNKEKIKVLTAKAKELKDEIKQKERQLEEIERRLKQFNSKNEALVTLLAYESYAEIDWQSIAKEIERLTEEQKELEESSDSIKQLKQELQKVESEIKKFGYERDLLMKEFDRTENRINDYEKRKEECQWELESASFPPEQNNERFTRFEEEYTRYLEILNFQNFEKVQRELEKDNSNEKDKLNQWKSKDEQRLSDKMAFFRNPGVEITSRFYDWGADTHKLPVEITYVDEYTALLEKIEREQLPAYRRKFEDYLSTTMINKIAGFKEFLDEGEESIIQNIETLNNSLSKISFKSIPSTYIQLRFPPKQDAEVKAFRKMLNEAIPHIKRLYADDGSQYKRQVFKHIQKLIDKLDAEENWRKKVTDVRNWKSYYAEEYYRENNEPKKVYKDMEKLSGGEKAQLTYTILGSAIAYQFGIKHEGKERESFRFIAVDETFSNQDDERANYLMDLCKQLHLQLLVVTPSDKIHIVEPHISYVHYVKRNQDRDSLLYDMPIKQFRERKERFAVTGREEIKN